MISTEDRPAQTEKTGQRGGHPPRWPLSLLLLAGILILLEWLFRAVFPLPEVSNFDRLTYSLRGICPEADTAPSLSHASYTTVSDPDGVAAVHTLNLYGFRDRNWHIKKTRPRVVFVGDSVLEGYLLQDDETIPRGFERAARAAADPVEAMNFGIIGARFAEYFLLLRDAVPLFKPDAVVLVCYANDFPGEPYADAWLKTPLVPQYNDRRIPRALAVLRRIRNHEPVAFGWSRPPFPFFAAVPSPANPWTERAAEFESFVDPAIAEAMNAGRFNPWISDELTWWEDILKKEIDVTPHLTALKGYVAKHGTALFVVYLPCRNQVSDYYTPFVTAYSRKKGITSLMSDEYRVHARSIAASCGKLDLPFLDFTPILEKRERDGIHCSWDYDSHLRGDTSRFVGERIYGWWRAAGQSPRDSSDTSDSAGT